MDLWNVSTLPARPAAAAPTKPRKSADLAALPSPFKY